jgi:hypothetical protein
MTRRRTIGDNPLDSIAVPPRPDSAKQAEAPKAPPPQIEAVADRASGGNESASGTQAGSSASNPFRALRQILPRRLKVVGGDVPSPEILLMRRGPDGPLGLLLTLRDFVELKRDVVRVVVETSVSDRRVGSLLLWATAGAAFLGPLGALAGCLYGGRERRGATAAIELVDGRRIVVATANPAILDEIQAELG